MVRRDRVAGRRRGAVFELDRRRRPGRSALQDAEVVPRDRDLGRRAPARSRGQVDSALVGGEEAGALVRARGDRQPHGIVERDVAHHARKLHRHPSARLRLREDLAPGDRGAPAAVVDHLAVVGTLQRGSIERIDDREVLAGAARDLLVGRAVACRDHIGLRSTCELVGARLPIDVVLAGSAVEGVRLRRARERVDLTATHDVLHDYAVALGGVELVVDGAVVGPGRRASPARGPRRRTRRCPCRLRPRARPGPRRLAACRRPSRPRRGPCPRRRRACRRRRLPARSRRRRRRTPSRCRHRRGRR